MRATLLLPFLAAAALGANVPRHGDDEHELEHEHGTMDMDMASDTAHVGVDNDFSSPSSSFLESIAIASPSVAPASSPSAASPPSDHAHGHAGGHAPGGHTHNPHAPVKEYLDDAALHMYHDFPPTYMDADFRLEKDMVIFGEVFPDDWDPETVASHPMLMVAHVGCMMLAYFVLLPVGE